MRANRKPSVKVVNLSCRFSNSLVTGIDQQPCESPEHKSPSFLQEEVKKIWFIMEENHLRCVQESCVRNTLFYPLLAFLIWAVFFSHVWGCPAQLDNFWGKPKMNEQSMPAWRESIDHWGISTIDVFLCQIECVKCMTNWAKIKAKVIIIPSLRASFWSSEGQCSRYTHLD